MDNNFFSMPKGFVEVEGVCATHGSSKVFLHPNLGAKEWYCDVCRAAKRKAEVDAEHRAIRIADLHKIAGIPQRYRGQRFQATTPAMKGVRSTVKTYRDLIAAGPKWAVLVLFGEPGTGKTLLASELGESLIDGLSMSVRYCTAKQMISEIQAAYSIEGKSEETEVMRFEQYDLLILDEIDAKPDRENANLLLNEVINRRYNAEKPVVVITNQPFAKLKAFVGDRVDDRLHENAFVCAFDWPSFRRG